MKKNDKIVIFNGAIENQKNNTSAILSAYIAQKIKSKGLEFEPYNIVDKDLPLLDLTRQDVPQKIKEMVAVFQEAELHFWLAPLYHGGIPGIMKNCLDWLEVTANDETPYLTDIKVGLICWADGSQAMQGINNMDSIAKSLRAWTLPYTIPMVRSQLTTTINSNTISPYYQQKIDRLIDLALSKQIVTKPAPF